LEARRASARQRHGLKRSKESKEVFVSYTHLFQQDIITGVLLLLLLKDILSPQKQKKYTKITKHTKHTKNKNKQLRESDHPQGTEAKTTISISRAPQCPVPLPVGTTILKGHWHMARALRPYPYVTRNKNTGSVDIGPAYISPAISGPTETCSADCGPNDTNSADTWHVSSSDVEPRTGTPAPTCRCCKLHGSRFHQHLQQNNLHCCSCRRFEIEHSRHHHNESYSRIRYRSH